MVVVRCVRNPLGLAHHEARNRLETAPPALPAEASYPRLDSVWIEDATGHARDSYEMGEDVLLCGTCHAPDDQPTVIMAGITRVDGTPVFGTFSNDAGFSPNRLSAQRFGFCVTFNATRLLPGRYYLRAHTLDRHGLRLFDTREVLLTIHGQTRDHGFVRLEHNWRSGHERPDRP